MQPNELIISIVTVVLNDLEGLRTTYDSLCVQHYKKYQWIVVDGKSTDGTLEFLSSINDVCFISESDEGIYDAMNKGVRLSSGDYVVFMNAGDIFHDADTLSCVVSNLMKYEVLPDVLWGGAIMMFGKRRSFYRAPKRFDDYIWHGLPANHQATYYKLGILGKSPYALKYRICEDYHLACTLFSKNITSTVLDAPLAVFRVGDTSYKHPWLVLSEAYEIQKDVLGLPLPVRVLSVIRRFVAISVALLLNK